MKKYISDIIGDNYLYWNPGDQIIISSQTGSGKSTFVFEKLLKNATDNGKFLVYFCNRRTLENQMKQTTGVFPHCICNPNIDLSRMEQDHLVIVTYQYCENSEQFPDIELWPREPDFTKEEIFKMKYKSIYKPYAVSKDEVMYYVFDEAHYFISDSLFNSNTNYWTPDMFMQDNSITVFLTATPEPLFCYINEAQLNLKWESNSFDNQNIPLCMDVVLNAINLALFERSKIKRSLEDIPLNIDLLNQLFLIFKMPYIGLDSVKLEFASEEEISEYLKNLPNPYVWGFTFIDNTLKSIEPYSQSNTRLYLCNTDYSYLEPIYIEEYDDVLDEIIVSNKKWLIFVDKEKKGKELESYLNQYGCPTVFISAKRRNNVRSGAKKTFSEIAETEKFECKVLIATSVLDCGVSIKDPELTNIVIAQPDKTEFIQMLGRRRVTDDEKIKLYIKNYTAQEINSLRLSMEKKLRFIIHFHMLNQKKPLLPMDIDTKKDVISDVIHSNNSSLLFVNKQFPSIDNLEYLSEYSISKTAYIQLLYSLRHYTDTLAEFQKTNDTAFYLKFQLSWLGIKYDESCWYKYKERLTSLVDYLENMCTKDWLDIEEQNKFSKECIELIIKLPTVLLTKNMISYIVRYKKSTTNKEKLSQTNDTMNNSGRRRMKKNGISLPGKNRLNNFFEEMNLPYTIISKQLHKNNRMWVWKITKKA